VNIYPSEITVKKTVVQGEITSQVEVTVYMNDQQPDIGPGDLKTIVKDILNGIERTP
jgi:hypothetical protein